MRFIHMADMHFDSNFSFLAEQADLSETRRLEQRQIFKNAIEYIQKESIPYLFISGDLYENNYIRETTITFINEQFKKIPNTKIFISPGNHDPITKNSFYNTFKFNDNVHIFNSEISAFEDGEVCIYGMGFSDFYCNGINLEKLQIKNKEKINILVIHASIDASANLELQYNPINSNKLKELGFDYVALGHIHKANYMDEETLVYPGSMISLGFDELGEHGMLDVTLNKENRNIKFIKMDSRIFEEKIIDITEMNSQEELVEDINEKQYEDGKMYKIILTGKRNFEININKIKKEILKKEILKIKDRTVENYNIDEIKNKNNLLGFFAREILNENNLEKYSEEEIKEALDIGINTLKNI